MIFQVWESSKYGKGKSKFHDFLYLREPSYKMYQEMLGKTDRHNMKY